MYICSINEVVIFKMNKLNSINTKDSIITTAFILFSSKPFDAVTYSDIEGKTGLSRGGIQHHVGSKMHLFKEAIKKSVDKRSSIIDIPLQDKNCLLNFIRNFVENCSLEKKAMKKLGIKNINLAHLNIEQQALYYFPDIATLAKQWLSTENKVWVNVINKAIEKKEIKSDVSVENLATLFQNTYIGTAYQGVMEDKGCDIEVLERNLLSIYHLIKV